MLNEQQTKAAQELLAERPQVLPGSRAILNYEQACAWHHKVTATMVRLGVRATDTEEFCDLAGVAD